MTPARLSSSKDTATLQHLLSAPPANNLYDAGDAGTTFRFLTAFLALQPGTKTLTRLRTHEGTTGRPPCSGAPYTGCTIEYPGKDGFPPLQIGRLFNSGVREIDVQADAAAIISALLLVAPYLPAGLTLKPEGRLVSGPYVEMTLSLMRYFGAGTTRTPDAITVSRESTSQSRS
jgi:3-phosphoshikimate 1-carboxyvinyltransferase